MQNIVSSVRNVTDIRERSPLPAEQTAGLEQINQAISQMDQVTQQNAALVEQAAAAAQSLQEQAYGLQQAVSVFKLERGMELTALPATPQPMPAQTWPGSPAQPSQAAGKRTDQNNGHAHAEGRARALVLVALMPRLV